MIVNIAAVLFSAALAATPCAGLKSVSLPNTTITIAESVPAGTFTPPGGGGGGGQRGGAPAGLAVPAFCRVAATLKPTSDSEIEMEVWLPENWNGKFQFVGGGGWAGRH
jgi:feruloyl esterase